MTNSFVAWLYFHFIPNSSILSKTSQQFTILIMTIWTLTFCTIVALKYTFISLKLLLHDLLSALTKRLLSLSRVHFFDNNQCLIRFLFTIHMFWLIGFTCKGCSLCSKKKDTVKKPIFLRDEPKQRLRRRLHVNMILLSVMTAAANRIRARKQLWLAVVTVITFPRLSTNENFPFLGISFSPTPCASILHWRPTLLRSFMKQCVQNKLARAFKTRKK